MQAEHAGTRTYYFSSDSHEEQEGWIRAMSEAAEVNSQSTQRTNSDTTDLNHTMVMKAPDPQTQQHPHTQTHNETDGDLRPHPDVNGVNSLETPPPSTPCSDQEGKKNDGRRGEGAKTGEDEGGRPGPDHTLTHHPNGWGNYGPPNSMPHNSSKPPPRGYGGHRAAEGHPETGVGPSHDSRAEQQENVVLRRGFVPRTAPERVAQRKSSMAQLQQWVNQRRGMASQEDLNSPSRYYPVNRGVSADYYGYPGGPQYMDEYPLYPPGVRPDSICSVSAVGGYDRQWTVEEKRRSLRDGPHQLYGPQMSRDPWGPQYYGGMETSMRRLSIQPRSRSVPRSPSSSSGGPYSPVPHNFASPARSPSARFDRFSGRMREDVIYADPSVYSLRRSLSSPKYDFPGDRRSLSQGLYHHNYPVSPSIHSKMVPPFHDVYSRELHPTLKLNEIETSKLLGRLCEQNRILKDHEAVVHRLRMEKDSLEEALVATHQEMELYINQPLIIEKLQFKKETQQNQLINIRGELSQASSAFTTTRMEFEALEDEANAIHGDLWEQLNAGGQSELVRRHIQKEFWRVQDVLEGLHKNNSSRGTDTAKHRVASGASGSFSTNSPASPLSSVSLTSPLSPFSPVPGCQASPAKQLGPEVSTGHTQLGATPNPKPGTGTCSEFRTSPEVRRRVCAKPRPKSCLVPNFKTDPKPRCRPKSYREPDAIRHAEHLNYYDCESRDHTSPQPTLVFQNLRESLGRLDPVVEETDPNISCWTNSNFDHPINPDKARAGEMISFLHSQSQESKYTKQHSDLVQTRSDIQEVSWLTSDGCSTEVRIGLRKDVHPDSHLSHLSAGYQEGHRKLSANRRRLSMPESQILFLQDSYRTDVLSLRCSPDLNTPSVPCFPSVSSGTQYHQQLTSQPLCNTETGARPLPYPNSPRERGIDPVICIVTQSDSPRSHSGKVFMQTHL